jgi:toxin YoeB
MEVVLMPTALEDTGFWKKSGNIQIQKRISMLLEEISNHPFEGVGKLEELKYALNGYWSRRIDSGHRIIYTLINDKIYIISCQYHYYKN